MRIVAPTPYFFGGGRPTLFFSFLLVLTLFKNLITNIKLKQDNFKKIFLAIISNTPFDQRSPLPLEEGVLNSHKHTDRQTDRQTDRHGDSLTESAPWGLFSEIFHVEI